MNSGVGWIRTPAALALLWAALVMSLVLGAGIVAVSHRGPDVAGTHAEPLTNGSAVAQVVNSAKQIVDAARLQHATGGYAFVSCTNEEDPPYQVSLYMSFVLPQTGSAKYLSGVATTMIANGWTAAPVPGEHFGQKLTKDGVTSVFYRNLDDAGFATMRLYGECRNTADHRNDNPAWTEVSL
jgi:hypothetical protein